MEGKSALIPKQNEILQGMKARTQKLKDDGEISPSDGLPVSSSTRDAELPVSSKSYGVEFMKIAIYLTTMKTPRGIDRKEFRMLKREALSYGVHSGRIWKLPVKGSPTKLVIDTEKEKARTLQS